MSDTLIGSVVRSLRYPRLRLNGLNLVFTRSLPRGGTDPGTALQFVSVQDSSGLQLGRLKFLRKMANHLHTLAEKLWHYHQMKHQLFPADAILVLCSHDKRVAERGAELFQEGWAPLLIFSGGLGSITRNIWSEPEADQFAEIAIGMRVPKDKILIENRSSNTGENILFTRQLLAKKQIDPQKFILVQKPYMERRSFATFRKLWPEKEVIVTSPQVSFFEYLDRYASKELSSDDVISIMVGDLQRIKLYSEMGFQIHQEIPSDIWSAYEELVRAGYNQHLIRA